MSTIYWTGSAPAVAGVKSWKFTTAGTTGDIITVTIGSKSYAYTTTSATIATFLPLLATALSGLSATVYPEFAEITWGSTSTTLTATDKTAGKPSIVTVTTNSGTTTINSGAITGATNATPIVITSTAHGLSTGTTVTIASVGGNTAANGTWVIDVTSANAFSLRTSAGNGAYTSGGTWTAPTGNTTTVSSGPYDISTAANYSGGALPVTGDTLYIDLPGSKLLYNLQTQSAVVLAVRRITARDVIIGLPRTNKDGTAYTEYRQDFWQCTATSDYVNAPQSGRIKLDHLTGQTAVIVAASGNGTETGIPAVLLKGTHSSNTFTFTGGNAGISYFLGAGASHVNVGRVDAGATVVCGIDCVNDTWNNTGGTLILNSAVGTALNHPSSGNARTTIYGTGAVASLQLQGGTVNYNTTGTLGGNTVLANNAFLNFDDDQRTKAVTNPISIYSNSVRLIDSKGAVAAGYTAKSIDCDWTPTSPRSNSQFAVTYL